jgi:anti-anti-sigma factor
MLLVNQNQNYFYLSFQNTKRFNVHNAKQVENELMDYISKPSSHVTLNMEGVSFIDSTAFECLLNIQRNAKIYNTDFRLGKVSEEVLDIIKIMQLDNVFKITPMEEYSG